MTFDQIPFDDDADEVKTWKGLALSAISDLRRYARDAGPERRLVSAEAYEQDAVRLEEGFSCKHEWVAGYDNHQCASCGAFRTDSGWGIASRMVFKSRPEAEFYQKNGRYPEPAHRL